MCVCVCVCVCVCAIKIYTFIVGCSSQNPYNALYSTANTTNSALCAMYIILPSVSVHKTSWQARSESSRSLISERSPALRQGAPLLSEISWPFQTRARRLERYRQTFIWAKILSNWYYRKQWIVVLLQRTYSVSLVVFKEMKKSIFGGRDYEGEKRNKRN